MNNAITIHITQRPRKDAVKRYEEWLKEIIPVAKNFKGYAGVNIIRPHSQHEDYTIVLHYESEAAAQKWFVSDARKALINKIQPYLSTEENIQTYTGFEFWFTPPEARPPAPTRKQFLITFSAIYPLTIIVPWALMPMFELLGISNFMLVTKFFIAAVIVALMVYLIMPRYVRYVADWLYHQ